MKNSDITDPEFRAAVEAIDCGDIVALQHLLETNPELVTKRLDVPTQGYFAYPYLLWFVADNPIRHEKLPSNIVDVTRTILRALQINFDNSHQDQIDYTLGLVSTGLIPRECKAQIPLMKLLIEEGAQVKGSVLGPIAQQNFEAAEFLLDQGAEYNFATAVALGRIKNVKKRMKNATAAELYLALVVAAFFGKVDMISLLVEAGANVNGHDAQKDFEGFHAHGTALHQAVSSGSLECVQLLVNAGASLEATDRIYHHTPLGWAAYMRSEERDATKGENYKEIENYLRSRQN